ncbi:interleukin-33 [Phascolarctos cinereus]|uniref:Interleukin-33 n=1 Tax=Phascolarctos cinereus TaxID=38626 RepID=A0A6P5LTZ6_PHACI|nr:interleukin-33 isoform X1 [Phascolarctos cinereus]XP_020862006.1 interleukin-33 isoform X1 [Phascolarctos cinereus]XP_020862007.1 interleukin-33 isoform X1 [Phascolarctos cinereus]
MKNLNGKQKNITNQKSKKTSQKPGVSNSGKDYQIIHKNLRSRCTVGNEASIIRHKMRSYQVKNMQFTSKQSTLNSFPPGFSNSGESYQIIYKNLRSRCIVGNEASVFRSAMRRQQAVHEAPFIKKRQKENRQYIDNKTFDSFPPELKSTKHYAGLNTSKNKAVIFSFDNGKPEILVEDLVGNQDRGLLSVEFFTSETSDEEDLFLPVVGLKLRHSDTDFQVLANDKNIELHESESQNSALKNKYFILRHKSELVSFECLSSQGLYIGVEEDQLKLMEKKDDEACMFQLLTE